MKLLSLPSPRSLSLFALGFVAWQGDASAQTVINGDFNTNGPSAGENITPFNWRHSNQVSNQAGLGDLNNASGTVNTEFSNFVSPYEWSDPVVSSPDGGNWLNLRAQSDGSLSGGLPGEEISQDVREWTITPGQQYFFSFERSHQPINSIAIPGLFPPQEGRLVLNFYGDTTGDLIRDTLIQSFEYNPIGTPQSWRAESGVLTIPGLPGQGPMLRSRTITVTFASLPPEGAPASTTSYLGVDNLQITPIPESTTPLLLGLTGLCTMLRRSRQ